jgi:hypothetical protein
MECNFRKSPEEFVELFYSIAFRNRLPDYDDTFEAIVMKEHDKDKNILTILKYFL